MIESWNHLTVISIEFVYDIWIIEVFRVPIEETTDWWLVLTEMCNHSSVYERIIWRFMSCCFSQNINGERNDLGYTQRSSTVMYKALFLFLIAPYQKTCYIL